MEIWVFGDAAIIYDLVWTQNILHSYVDTISSSGDCTHNLYGDILESMYCAYAPSMIVSLLWRIETFQ